MAADDARRAYASNDDLRDAMRRLSASDGACAGISRVVSLGRSANGEDVRALLDLYSNGTPEPDLILVDIGGLSSVHGELEALGWWTRGADGNPCVLGDFVSA